MKPIFDPIFPILEPVDDSVMQEPIDAISNPVQPPDLPELPIVSHTPTATPTLVPRHSQRHKVPPT